MFRTVLLLVVATGGAAGAGAQCANRQGFANDVRVWQHGPSADARWTARADLAAAAD